METNANQLENLATLVSELSPVLSRFYLTRSKEVNGRKENTGKNILQRCSFCCNMLTSGNHEIKMSPKPKLTKKLIRLLKKYKPAEYHLMGKFQRKLMDNFNKGNNKVIIRCRLCGKVRKFDGQTRAQKCAQKERGRQLAVHALNMENVKVLTKKEKKKEKKKLLKKKRKEGVTDEDKNAGLRLPGESEIMEVTEPVLHSRELSSFRSSESFTPDRTPSIACTSRSSISIRSSDNFDLPTQHQATRPSSQCVLDISDTVPCTCNTLSVKSIAPLSSITSLSESSPARSVTSFVKSVPSSVARVTVSATQVINKKNKVKMKGQQLSKMLKKEQNKSKEGSLADFLSSL